MLIEFFKRLEKSKWLPWVGISPFIIFPLTIIFDGKMWKGIGILAFIASAYAGIVLGRLFGNFFNTHILKQSSEFGKRLTAAFSCFGFLLLPPLVGSWTNAQLYTDIEMYSLGAYFLWACVGGGIFFLVKPSVSEQKTTD